MAADWKTIGWDDVSQEEPQRPNRSHAFVAVSPKVPYPNFCRYCGHIPLKNWISKLVTKIGCGFEADPRYKEWLRTKRALD